MKSNKALIYARFAALLLVVALILCGIWVSSWWISAKFFATAGVVAIAMIMVDVEVTGSGEGDE